MPLSLFAFRVHALAHSGHKWSLARSAEQGGRVGKGLVAKRARERLRGNARHSAVGQWAP
jgi:hypothetical protein